MTGLVWEKRWGLLSVMFYICTPTLVLGIDVGTMGHWGHVPRNCEGLPHLLIKHMHIHSFVMLLSDGLVTAVLAMSP